MVLVAFRAIVVAVFVCSTAPTWGAQDATSLRAARAEAVRMRNDLNQRIAEIDRQLGQEREPAAVPSVNAFADLPATGAGYVARTRPPHSYSPSSSSSTCYVGPRGGTYTITKSGRKNYGGC